MAARRPRPWPLRADACPRARGRPAPSRPPPPGPPAAAQARTVSVAFTPFAADGALRAGLRDAPASASAACATGSFLLPGTGVLRCAVGVRGHDPCWLDVASSTLTAPVVACLAAPWRRDVLRLRVAPRDLHGAGGARPGGPPRALTLAAGRPLPGRAGREPARPRPPPALPLRGAAVPVRRPRRAAADLAHPSRPQRGRRAPAAGGDPAGVGRRPRRPGRRLGSGALARLGEQALGHAVGGVGAAADEAPLELRAAEVQRRVVLPRRSDAAVRLDVLPRGVVERPAGRRPGRAGRQGELRGRVLGRPSRRSRAASARSPAGAGPRSARA